MTDTQYDVELDTIPVPTRVQVSPHELLVDQQVQRNLNKGRVNKMAAEFDPAGLGVISLSQRPSGLYIVDGQHRTEAAKVAGWPGKMEANLYTGLTRAQEARLFLRLNATGKPTALDMFKVRIEWGDPEVLDMHKALTDYGWTYGTSITDGTFAAVASLERAWRISPQAVRSALAIITNAWGHQVTGVDGRILLGLTRVLARDAGFVDLNNLTEKLKGYPGGPRAFLGQAQGLRNVQGGRIDLAVAQTVISTYNKSKRAGTTLDAWR